MEPYVRVECDDRDLQQVQNSLIDVFHSLAPNPLLGQVNIIKNVSITTNDTSIAHMLGKNVTGWIVVNKNAPENIYQSSTNNLMSAAFIILKASGNVTADILFF